MPVPGWAGPLATRWRRVSGTPLGRASILGRCQHVDIGAHDVIMASGRRSGSIGVVGGLRLLAPLGVLGLLGPLGPLEAA